MRILTKLALCSALFTVAGFSVAAADLPGNQTTTATIVVPTTRADGSNDFAGDSDWYRVTLTKGIDYAIQSWASNEIIVNVRSNQGTVLGFKKNRQGAISGFEFRAPYTGNYFIEYKDLAKISTGFYPSSYHPTIAYDCKASAASECTVDLNSARRWNFAFSDDTDWLGVTLAKGKRYRIDFGIVIGNMTTTVRLARSDGATLRVPDKVEEDDKGNIHYVISSFSPSSTARYFVIGTDEEANDYQYTVRITSL